MEGVGTKLAHKDKDVGSPASCIIFYTISELDWLWRLSFSICILPDFTSEVPMSLPLIPPSFRQSQSQMGGVGIVFVKASTRLQFTRWNIDMEALHACLIQVCKNVAATPEIVDCLFLCCGHSPSWRAYLEIMCLYLMLSTSFRIFCPRSYARTSRLFHTCADPCSHLHERKSFYITGTNSSTLSINLHTWRHFRFTSAHVSEAVIAQVSRKTTIYISRMTKSVAPRSLPVLTLLGRKRIANG